MSYLITDVIALEYWLIFVYNMKVIFYGAGFPHHGCGCCCYSGFEAVLCWRRAGRPQSNQDTVIPTTIGFISLWFTFVLVNSFQVYRYIDSFWVTEP